MDAAPNGSGSAAPSGNVPVLVDPAVVEGEVRKVLESGSVSPAQAERLAPEVVQVTASLWQAPLPPPRILSEYEDIVPGAAKEIISAFVSEAENRQTIERWQIGLQVAGLACGVLVVLCMLGVVGFGLYLGYEAVGIAVVVALAAVAGVFVIRHPSSAKKEVPERKLTRAERRRRQRGLRQLSD